MQQLLTERTGRMVLATFLATLMVTAGLTGVVVGAPAADTTQTLDGCSTIDEPGTYTLTRNITDAPAGGCISVHADGVTVDGNGHTIVGNGSGVAVSATAADGFTLRNVTLTNWATGVVVTAGAAGPAVRNVTVQNGSVGVGIYSGGVAATVADSHFRNLTTVGVALHADSGRVVDNEFVTTGGPAITLVASDDSLVARNELRATHGGIVVTDAAGVTVASNTLHSVNGTGIHVVGSGERLWASRAFDTPLSIAIHLWPSTPTDPNEVVNNSVYETDGNGILVENASDVMVTENLVVRNRDGIHVAHTDGAVVVGNDALANYEDGISLGIAPRGVVYNNTLRNNSDDGLYVVGNNTSLTGNLVVSNGDDGIDVQNSTAVTVRRNTVTTNRNDGIYLRGVAEALVEANVARGNDDDGIDLRGTDMVTVANNTVCGNGDQQVIARTGTNRTTLENNSC